MAPCPSNQRLLLPQKDERTVAWCQDDAYLQEPLLLRQGLARPAFACVSRAPAGGSSYPFGYPNWERKREWTPHDRTLLSRVSSPKWWRRGSASFSTRNSTSKTNPSPA